MKSHIDNRNPKLMASTGSVLYDQPHIHVDVTADFYMFTPVRKDDLFEKRILIALFMLLIFLLAGQGQHLVRHCE